MYKKGFTLVEFTIILTVAILIISSGFTAVKSINKANKHKNIKMNIESAIRAVTEYSGRAQTIPLSLSTILTNGNDSDILGNKLYYKSATELNTNNGSICNTRSTTLSILKCSDIDCSDEQTYNNIAFFISSDSLNELQQITPSDDEIKIYDEDVTIDGSDYDDINGWITLDTLKKYAGCQDRSIEIAENELPNLHYFYDDVLEEHYYDGYGFDLNPISNKSGFSWCVESAAPDVRGYLNFGANNLDNDCSTDNDYVTSSSISLNAPRGILSDKLPSSSVIRVYLKDSSSNILTKDYILAVKESNVQKSSFVNNDEEGIEPVKISPVSGGDVKDFALFKEDTEGATPEDSNYLISDSDNDGAADTIKIVQNANINPISMFYGCESEEFPDIPCPIFGNSGILNAYFTAEFYNNTSRSYNPQGFTFAVIRSKFETKLGEIESTENNTGHNNSGLGYGRTCDGDLYGIKGGNSFAIEFDVYKDNDCTKDPDDDHIAIVTYASINNFYANIGKDQTGYIHLFSQFGNNNHEKLGNGMGFATNYNTACTASGESGESCYYNTSESEDVIPNTYAESTDLFGVRIEAISGCNSDGTECDKQSGANNHICIHMWKRMKTDMDDNTSLKSDMTDVSTSHIYNNITKERDIPIGEPLVKYCYVDDTTTQNTLDKIRFGFTSGANSISEDFYYFQFTDLKVNVGAY